MESAYSLHKEKSKNEYVEKKRKNKRVREKEKSRETIRDYGDNIKHQLPLRNTTNTEKRKGTKKRSIKSGCLTGIKDSM